MRLLPRRYDSSSGMSTTATRTYFMREVMNSYERYRTILSGDGLAGGLRAEP